MMERWRSVQDSTAPTSSSSAKRTVHSNTGLFCTVSEIIADVDQKPNFVHTVFNAPLRVLPSEFYDDVWVTKQTGMSLTGGEKV